MEGGGVCVVGGIHGRGGMHGRGHVWLGGMHGRGCAWQEHMYGRGTCMAEWEVCGGGGGHAWHRGHVWQGACMTGRGHACVAGETAILLECILVKTTFTPGKTHTESYRI